MSEPGPGTERRMHLSLVEREYGGLLRNFLATLEDDDPDLARNVRVETEPRTLCYSNIIVTSEENGLKLAARFVEWLRCYYPTAVPFFTPPEPLDGGAAGPDP